MAKENGGQPYRDLVAMSIVAGDRVKRLDAALESFSKVAVANMDQIAVEVARARAKALEFVIKLPGSGARDSIDHIDLGDFLRHLDNLPPDVEVARDAAFAALKASVTAQVTGRATEQATGLNVFLPDRLRAGPWLRRERHRTSRVGRVRHRVPGGGRRCRPRVERVSGSSASRPRCSRWIRRVSRSPGS